MPLLRRFQSPAPGKLDLRQVFEKQGDRLPKRAETAGADLGASAIWSAGRRLKALTKTSPGLVPALAASCLSVVHPLLQKGEGKERKSESFLPRAVFSLSRPPPFSKRGWTTLRQDAASAGTRPGEVPKLVYARKRRSFCTGLFSPFFWTAFKRAGFPDFDAEH